MGVEAGEEPHCVIMRMSTDIRGRLFTSTLSLTTLELVLSLPNYTYLSFPPQVSSRLKYT
jgi:hypothetical protein